jgi:hypothetical protein
LHLNEILDTVIPESLVASAIIIMERTIESVKLRHELLKLKDKEISLFRDLDKLESFDEEHLYSEKFLLFGNISSAAEEFIVQLGAEPFESNDQFKEAEKMVEKISEQYDLMIGELKKQYL